MQRIIAVSDSHGAAESLREALALAASKGKIDYFVFLGDGLSDWEAVKSALQSKFPQTQWVAVRGNNDFRGSLPSLAEWTVHGRKIMAAHGHEFHVKLGPQTLCYAARERQASVALYGHTHSPCLEEAYGVLLLNPGALSNPFSPAYGEILIKKSGEIKANLIAWTGFPL